MKKIRAALLVSCLLSLASCDVFDFESLVQDNKDQHNNDNNNNNENNQTNTHIHTFSSSWSSDSENHWHSATCEHTTEVSYKAPHRFSDWEMMEAPTLTSSGTKRRVCSTCLYEQIENIPQLQRDGSTIESALNVDEFIELAKLLPINGISDREYYVTGVVSNAKVNTKYNSYYFYFEGHETAENDIAYIYSANMDSSITADYSSNPSALNGKTVTVFGYLKKFYKVGEDVKCEICFLNGDESPTKESYAPRIVYIDDGEVAHTHSYSTAWTTNESYHWHNATCEHSTLVKDKALHSFSDWNIEREPSKTLEGLKTRSCSVCGIEETESIDKIVEGTGTFTLYTFNDFHGAVQEYSSSQHVGLAKFATYLKNVKDQNSIIVDSGDTFQGSIESNYNNGALVSDVFNYAGVDVHTIGNHDFDWGQDKLVANKQRKYGTANFSSHYLGANIYDYDFDLGYEGNTFQSKFGDQYYVKTLGNGIKVGVIGAIPKSQITTICSPLVQDICFKEHIAEIQSISNSLRSEGKADVIIVSVHEGATDTMELGLANVSPVTNKKYADYVCCAHTHRDECYSENGVYYTQAACYGEMLYKSTFTVEKGNISNVDVTKLNYSTITNAVTKVDSTISSIIDTYSADYKSVGNEVVASSTNGTFSKTGAAANLLAQAMYYTAENQGYSVDIACTNNARYNLTGTSWKYSQVYESFPFDNVVYIVKCKGSKNVKELCYSGNYCYHESDVNTMNTSTWYTAAVIDYLLFHTNDNRKYDYFDHSSSNMQILGTIKNSSGGNFLYRDIFATYVKGLSGTLNASSFATSGNYAVPSY